MNPIVWYFASGESLYAGAATLLAAVAISAYLRDRWLLLRSIAAWFGLAMIVMACPPCGWSLDALFLTTFALWFISSNRTQQAGMFGRLRLPVTALLLVLLLLLPALELRRRAMPLITGPASDHLVVIGDSISSGIDPHVPAWPLIMQRATGVPVKNLSLAGAQVIEAVDVAARVSSEDNLVLVEVGGNDLLADVPSDRFEQGLEALLRKLVSPSRTVVMFELPLLPHRIAYGQIQRRLAAKYGVWLIPKRFLVDVLSAEGATSDGLHLSEAGAHRMAALVTRTLSPVLKVRPDSL
jgi:acyl-CoA thioesterase I